MQTKTIIQMIVLFVLLILSGLFSSAETSLTTVNIYKMKALAEEGNRRAKMVLNLMENPGKVLSTILIGNNIVNISASSLMTILVTDLFGSAAVGIATGILTVLVLIFGEITPKNLATIYSEKFALFYAIPIRFLSIILTPVIWLLDKFCNLIYRILRIDLNDLNKQMTESELRTIVNVSHEDGVIEGEEKEMITNVVDFGDSVAKDIMIPRADITMAPIDADFEEVLGYFMDEQYSRIPIYEENKENVVGILHLKDLFFYREQSKDDFQIRTIMREPYYTYEYQKTSGILEEMREKSVSITIVLDEYGTAAGMITLEDLLEEIVGEIRDEYDEYEEEIIKQTGENQFEVDGGAKIDDVNDALGLHLESDDYDSIGGYVIELLDHLPETGEVVEDEVAVFEVLEADKTRVERIRITLFEEEEPQDVTE
ncbi:MAG: HlyC/CorC family transporter [Lachnospiraceae bacterium]|nr:HlyC/CorC family transporter [Lachnospiraceae bacterium]